MKLILGSKTWSSWSMRPWLALRLADIAFEEEVIDFSRDDRWDEVRKLSPSAKVPLLLDGDLVIPESLAIIDYVHNLNPLAALYPSDIRLKVQQYAAAVEMHAGFEILRKQCPMNLRLLDRPSKITASEALQRDVMRIDTLWQQLRKAIGGGNYLAGEHMGAVDCMFAPVVARFRGYGLSVSAISDVYMEAVIAHPLFDEWREAARQETGDYDG